MPRRSARRARAAPQAPSGDHPEPEAGPAGALRGLPALDPAEPTAHVLDEAHAPPARSVPLPALGRPVASPLGRPDSRHEHRARLPRRIPDPSQRAALPPAARLRRPDAGTAAGEAERTGMADHTMVLVTADHGYAWQVGVETRRSVNPSNVEELAPVPFFVRAPGQRRGRVKEARANARRGPDDRRHAGRAARLSAAMGARRSRPRSSAGAGWRWSRATSARWCASPGPRWQAPRRAVVARRLRQFGSGAWASLFTGIGPNRGLIGRQVATLRRSSAAGAREPRGRVRPGAACERDGARRNRGSRPRGGSATTCSLAVAVNGRIEAVGRSFHLTGDPTERFAVNVPEDALREGTNVVEVFEVTSGRGASAARPLLSL